MVLPKPDLGERNFDDLVEEAKKLIPIYAPEWTDHNLNDLGNTSLDFLVWLAGEMHQRNNRITDGQRRKFLKLVGFLPQLPKPAHVHITFYSPGIIRKGEKISTIASDSIIPFELDEDLVVVDTRLKKIVVEGKRNGIILRRKENEVYNVDSSPNDLTIESNCIIYLGLSKPVEHLTFLCYIHEKNRISPIIDRDVLGSSCPKLKLRWEYYVKNNWIPIPSVEDRTLGFQQSGTVILRYMKMDITQRTSKISALKGLEITEDINFWIRCIVEQSPIKTQTFTLTIQPNSVSATQGLTIRTPLTSKGTGLPTQVINLKKIPVRRNNPILPIEGTNIEGGLEKNIWIQRENAKLSINTVEWEIVEDFDGSGPDDTHYVIDPCRGEVRFGDGRNGAIPEANKTIQINCFRIICGLKGNIKANAAWHFRGSIDRTICNRFSASDGSDCETFDEAISRFLVELKTDWIEKN